MILAIGDGHVLAASPRHDLQLAALEQIVRLAETLKAEGRLGVIVWPGDLLHRESVIGDRRVVLDVLEALEALATVLVIRGNHDAPGELELLGRVGRRHGIRVVTRPEVVALSLPGDLVAHIACLPYPTKAGLLAQDVPADQMAAAVARALEQIFLDFGARLVDALQANPGRVAPLFLGHVTLGGAMLSVGQPLIGEDLQISHAHLAMLPAGTLPVLNHIHKPQVLGAAYYVGSIAPVDWGEVERKRVLVLEHRAGAWAVESVPLDLPALYHVDAAVGGAWTVRRGPDGEQLEAPASWRNAEVRIRLHFPASEARRLDATKARLMADFAEARLVKIEPVAEPDRALRAPAVRAASTLPEKVAAWGELAGVDWEPAAAAEHLAALEAPDFVDRLQARLASELRAVVEG